MNVIAPTYGHTSLFLCETIPSSMRILGIWILMLIGCSVGAQSHLIEVDLKDYPDSTFLLGYHFGNTQYTSDTIKRDADGVFRIQGNELLIPGIYLLVLNPDNRFVEFLVEEKNQHMKMSLNAQDAVNTFSATGSPANESFYEYLRFLQKYQSQISELRAAAKADSTNTELAAKVGQQITTLKEDVKKGQSRWLDNDPDGFVSAIIKANAPMDLPEFTGTDDEINNQRWRYYQEHYFDQISLSDVRLLRTPILLSRVDYYLDKLTIQDPDTLITTIDFILAEMSANDLVFKFGISHLLNKYAASNIIGMDAIYVHLIENYYAKGRTPWVASENIAKMAKQAAKVKPLLIGKRAPDVNVYKRDGSPINLHGIDSPFTVLFFWAPDCGHCKKSMPKMVEFYNDYSSKGVEIMAVCTKSREKEAECWTLVDQKGMDIWVNASDKDLKSRFQLTYDIRSTPQIYVLDQDKNIIMKRIGTEQLPALMDDLLARQTHIK